MRVAQKRAAAAVPKWIEDDGLSSVGRRRPHPAAEAIAQEQLDLTVVLERVARVVIVAAVALVGEYNEAHVLAGAAKPESMCEASLAFVREPRESVANLRRFI